MKRTSAIKPLAVGAALRQLSLAAPVLAIPSDQAMGAEARANLYQSSRWRSERAAFLKNNPICATRNCGRKATIVDHRDGHQRSDWLALFWDRSRWQPVCAECHN